MPHEIIVFDTNALRSIGSTHAQSFVAAHRQRSIVSVTSKYVAFELVSAAAGPDPQDSDSARHAIYALTQLTQCYDGRAFIPFTQSPLEQRVLTREQRQADDQLVRRLGHLLLEIAANDGPALDPDLRVAAAEVREMVLVRERKYGEALYEAGRMAVALMREYANVTSTREAQKATMRYLRERGGPFTAEILALFRPHLDEKSSADELAPEVEWMLENAATAVAFIHQQVSLSAGGEIDPRQPTHANSVWDARVCALVDKRARLASIYGGAPLYVVSSERQIVNAATSAGERERLRRLGEHCRVIGLGDLAHAKSWT